MLPGTANRNRAWLATQRAGVWAFALATGHFSLLEYGEWIKWCKTFEPALPPLSLLGGLAAAFVLIAWFVPGGADPAP